MRQSTYEALGRAAFVVALAGALAFGIAGCGSAGSGSGSRDRLGSVGEGLRGPAGMKATVYARGLRTMSAFALDSHDRLWVTTSGYSNHANDGLYLVGRPGHAPVKVVSGLKGPLGLTWYRDKLYVASIGRVDAFSGFRGTRFASRKMILRGPVAKGENNNLVLGPHGRLVMGVSAPCDHCTPKSKWAASIVSFKPDGSDLRIYADGVRAAFGLANYPGTSDLLVSMNQRDDLGVRTPGDWLAVVRKGQNWGFPNCYGQGGAVCARVPKPAAVLDKHAAAGGVAIVRGQLGAKVGSVVVVVEWQFGKVQCVAFVKSGSTYEGSVAPFLTGLKNSLLVLSVCDGTVLVGDWMMGTIYWVFGV